MRGSATCVCAITFDAGWHGELTSCRGTVLSAWQKPPVRRKKEEELGCPQRYVVATWCLDDSPHLSLPRTAAVFTGGRGTAPGQQGRLVSALHPGQDRRLPDVVTRPRPWRVTWAPLDQRWGPGQPGSGVAIDWVTGRSCSSTISKRRDGSTCSQACVRAAPCCGSSVATRDRV